MNYKVAGVRLGTGKGAGSYRNLKFWDIKFYCDLKI